MSIIHHHLKTETEYFQAIELGFKKFEFRKNDRNYQVNDLLYLEETENGVYTGRRLPPKEIKYIFYGGKYGLPEGYCIMCW